METEMTNELKAKFFAQYYGQEVLSYKSSPNTLEKLVYWRLNFTSTSDPIMLLKPLSSITGEDAIEVGKLLNWSEPHEFKNFFLGFNTCTPTGGLQIDFFRSKGYALEWMGISVEQQIKSGWVKLITDK